MRSQYTLIHIEIVWNVHTFILPCIFTGRGNEMSPEKKPAPLSFLASTLILLLYSKYTNENFLPDWLKKNNNKFSWPALRLNNAYRFRIYYI